MINTCFIGMLDVIWSDFYIMRISFIGAGRVATHLAQVLKQQHEIHQIYSKSILTAQALAQQVGAQAIEDYTQLNCHIDLVIIAVNDQAIAAVIQQLQKYVPNVLVVHTSGSTHLDVLAQQHANVGVFYPLQTFSLDRTIDWKNTPLFIEAPKIQYEALLLQLANSLSNKVYQYTSEQRLNLHLAAVFACNFTNYCYDMAEQILTQHQVDFSLLYPLIRETAHKATQHSPYDMQTGPAMRGDKNILKMHQNMLYNNQQHDFAQIYTLLSEHILQHHQK